MWAGFDAYPHKLNITKTLMCYNFSILTKSMERNMENMEFEKSCGAVIYRNLKGKIEFLAVRSKSYGHWGFPKGHVEKGEIEEDTAKREVLEEVGLNIILTSDFRTKTEYFVSENIKKEVVFFISKVSDQSVKIQLEEIADYRWAGFEEMIKLLTFDNDKSVLKEAYSYVLVQC